MQQALQLAQINDTQVSVINFKSVPVLMTEQLANFYGTEPVRIRQNQHENKQRFIEGKHFFKIMGQELKDFVSSLKLLTSSPVISNKVRSLILWTERGAARHAKMLDTDQAWDVFEQLEDCYFHRQEILAKTHKSDREPLTNAVNMLVAKTKHLNFSEAYKLVHQRFNVKHIDEIPFDSIPVAVEYVHHLIAMYSAAEKQPKQPDHIDLIKNLVDCILSQNFMTSDIYRAIHMLDSDKGRYLAQYVFDTNIAALKLTRAMDMRDNQGRKIISDDLCGGTSTKGLGFTGKRWFHPLVESGKLMGALQISGGW